MTLPRETDANAIAQGMRESSTDATENDNVPAAYEEHQRVKGKNTAHRGTQRRKPQAPHRRVDPTGKTTSRTAMDVI